MIGRLIRHFSAPQPRDADPERRLRALQRLQADTAEDAAILERLAREDAEPRVREAAVARLARPAALLDLATEQAVAAAAQMRLADVADAWVMQDLMGATKDPARLQVLLALAPDDDLREQCLARLNDETALVAIATTHSAPRTRLAAARRVRSGTGLRDVERASRGRDKAVLRHAREAQARLKAARRRDADRYATLETITADLEQLLQRSDDPQLNERLAWLERRFNEVLKGDEGLTAELRAFDEVPSSVDRLTERFRDARTTLNAHVASAAAARETRAARDAECASDQAEQADAIRALERLEQQLDAQLASNVFDPAESASTLHAALETETSRWRSACAGEPAAQVLSRRYSAVADRLHALAGAAGALVALERETLPALPEVDAATLEPPADGDAPAALPWSSRDAVREVTTQLKTRRQSVGWPARYAVPPALAELDARIEAGAALLERFDVLERMLLARFDETCQAAEQILGSGAIGSTPAHLARARRLLAALPEGAPGKRGARLRRLSGRLGELEDWQCYATGPKRTAFCEEMEALAETELAPPEKAERVKRLRAQWNDLGPVRDAAQQTLRERFDSAAERAFRPCRAYFEAVASQRRANLKRREQICVELEHFVAEYDWTQPDWTAVERIYRGARLEWRQFGDVDPKASRAVRQRFNQVLGALRRRLEGEWQANVERKEAIVAEAQRLAEDEHAPAAAADRAKTLQQSWNAVGLTPRGADRRLWKGFREACDIVFARRDAERKARSERAHADLARLAELIASVEASVVAQRACALEAIEPETCDTASAQALEEGLAALDLAGTPNPTRESARTLERRGRDALAGLAALRARLPLRASVLRARALITCDARIAEGRDDGAPQAQTLAPDAARWHGALESRLQDPHAASAGCEADPRWDACIDIEVLAGLESPAEDGERRLQRQVERLADGMAGGTRAPPLHARLDTALERFIATPAAADEGSTLRQRMTHALDALAAAH